MLVDQLAGLDGLRAVGLPSASGKGVLGSRGKHAETYDETRPDEHHDAAMATRPAAEATQPAIGRPATRRGERRRFLP
jgi:hypothetical protein